MALFNNRKLSPKVYITQTIAHFGTQCIWMMESYFLLFFYTDVIQIPPLAATIFMAIARVWDAINDPMMGVICDKTRSKEGKARFWLKYMSVPAGLCIALTYICPDISVGGRIAWVSVTYLIMGMAKTAVGVPASTLTATMTTDRLERVKLAQYTGIAGLFPNVVVPALTMPLVRAFGGEDLVKGFAVLAIILGVIVAASYLLIYWGSKGYDPDTSQAAAEAGAEKKSAPNTKELLRAALTNPYCLLASLIFCLYLLMAGIMTSTILYYFTYNLGNEDLMGIYSSTVAVGAVISLLFVRVLCKKVGNSMTCLIGGVICVVAFIPRILTSDQVLPVFIVSIVLCGVGSGLVSNVNRQCILDATSWGKLHTGVDNSAVIMSIYSFAQKFGTAASTVIAAGLLALFHYEGGQTPTPAVLKLFYVENIVVPVVIAIAMIVLLAILHRMEKQLLKDLAEVENVDTK